MITEELYEVRGEMKAAKGKAVVVIWEQEEKLGGLWLPQKAERERDRQKLMVGVVESIGEGDAEFSVGDTVFIDDYSGLDVMNGGKRKMVILIEDVIGVYV
ncbi:hypothetical protein N9104_01725 [Pseudomonadales bacterium]|nr:hypothetical protein [Pseudomonadales bacterium]